VTDQIDDDLGSI